MSISAVILSFNAKRDLERCISSLIEVEGLAAGRDQILVIDNGSTDGSQAVIERLVAAHPGLVDATFLAANLGTTISRNLGFAKASGDHLLVIDCDIYFETSVLQPLIEQLAADPSIGIIAPKLIFPDGRPQMSTDVFPTVLRKLERLFRLRALERRDRPGQARSRPVDYAISAFWLMRRELVDLVGPLDERIVYAPEDVDFCLRTWLEGKRVVHRPDLEVVHDAKERSRSLRGLLFTWRHLLGLAYFFRKHRYAFSTRALYRRIGRLRINTAPASGGGGAREAESGAGG
ncbi:MAG: glycosyltransferase family 2 protein [Alphaproteobacteria bacterium]|nr:glycosyltransferase family 2 protein [Alphaproteobacteria bacterium]